MTKKKLSQRVKQAHQRITVLRNWSLEIGTKNKEQDDSFNALKGTVDAIVAGVPTITDALKALEAGLLEIQAALEDDTTGLLGLNLARPQFGAFAGSGTILGGTGQVTGASGPKTNATTGTALGHPGIYLVDFGNDVSERMYSVNVFSYVPALLGGGGVTPSGSALNCAASAAIATLCGAMQGGAADADPNLVFVQVGDGTAAATNGFSVTAISG